MDVVDGIDGWVLARVLVHPVGLVGVVVDAGMCAGENLLPDVLLEVCEQVAGLRRAVAPLGDLLEGDAVDAAHVITDCGAVGFIDYDILYLCVQDKGRQREEESKDISHDTSFCLQI